MENEFEINSSVKRSIYLCTILIIASLLILLGKSILYSDSSKSVILKEALATSFLGKVDSVYYDNTMHNVKTVVLSSGYIYRLYPRWDSQVNLGDTLYKIKGSPIVTVHKKNRTKTVLDYRLLIRDLR